jgi:hypothetical protein
MYSIPVKSVLSGEGSNAAIWQDVRGGKQALTRAELDTRRTASYRGKSAKAGVEAGRRKAEPEISGRRAGSKPFWCGHFFAGNYRKPNGILHCSSWRGMDRLSMPSKIGLLVSEAHVVDVHRVRIFVSVAIDLIVHRDSPPVAIGRIVVAVNDGSLTVQRNRAE